MFSFKAAVSSEIHFFSDGDSGLSVTIDTKRLHIESVQPTEEEYARYALLFGDSVVMSKYGMGKTKQAKEIRERIEYFWARLWHKKDPYSGMAVFKRDTDDFLGHVVLGHCNDPGIAELAYLFHSAWWGKGYGTEAVSAVVKEYAPATVQAGYILDGQPLDRIVAVARSDNLASSRILEKVGMHKMCTDEKGGISRDHYVVRLNELCQ